MVHSAAPQVMAKTLNILPEFVVRVDDDDFEDISRFKWGAHQAGCSVYAARRATTNGRREIVYLHRYLCGSDAIRVVFKDGDPTNCQRSNLVVAKRRPVRESINTGVAGEASVLFDLVRKGHEVFTPFSGSSAADIISLRPGMPPLRWQVKTRKAVGLSVSVRLAGVHQSAGGAVWKPIDMTQIDGLAITGANQREVFYIPVSAVAPGATSLTVNMGSKGTTCGRPTADFVHPDNVYDTVYGTSDE